MSRDEILSMLRSHEAELRARGVSSLSLFGSAARGDGGPDSDIDVAVHLGPNFARPGFDYLARLDELEDRLTRWLNRKVDVVEEPVRRGNIQRAIDRDRARAF